jgi:cytochrome c553
MRNATSKLAAAALLTVGLLVAGSAPAADDAAIEQKAKTICAACHGPDGNTPTGPDFPKIGGQYYDYLLHSLKAYKSGARKNPIMAGQVQALSPEEMEGLAAYFSGQSGTLVTKE